MLKIPYALRPEYTDQFIYAEKAQKQVDYICPACNEKVRLKKGSIRCTHFFHSASSSCTNESYLHHMAKYLVFKHLQNTKTIQIDYEYKNSLKKEQYLNAFKLNNHRAFQNVRDNIYDSREIKQELINIENLIPKLETKYLDFRPDILLSQRQQLNLLEDSFMYDKSIFIEIVVTNASNYKKISSGIPIIEIKVRNFDDLGKIMNNDYDQLPVKLYNFDFVKKKTMNMKIEFIVS